MKNAFIYLGARENAILVCLFSGQRNFVCRPFAAQHGGRYIRLGAIKLRIAMRWACSLFGTM